MATTAVRELRPTEFLAELEVLLAIYGSAMKADAALLPGRRELMRRHAEYPSFQALLASAEAPSSSGRHWPVGFAYGFRGQHGQWWFDAVWNALSRATSASVAAQWLTDSLEVAEVHVHEDHQRAGIGTSMLMTLTRGRPERTAVLSTPDAETTARRLYRRLGFRDLLTGYSFPGGSPPYAVMGAVLPLHDPAAAAARPRSASPSIW
jgi:ribosomal protein S18 acetylase RimI-like enzyme